MVDSVLFYISAASDVHHERDLLSQMVTEIPVTLGWEIHLSPLREKQIDENLIRSADIHLLVLGEDIRAPIGLEWFIARRWRRLPILFQRRGIFCTPAARDFYRRLAKSYTWQPYANLEHLRHIALHSISTFLLSKRTYFELDQSEVEQLSTFVEELKGSEAEQIEHLYGGTGEDSIILSPERYIPSSGVLIQKPDQEDGEN